MADVAAAAPVKTPTKKSTKAKKPKKVATHPQYSEMIATAIKALKDKKGASRQAIVSYVVSNFKLDHKAATVRVRMALKRGVINKSLKIVKGTGASGRFRLNEDAKPKKTAAKKDAMKPKAAKKSPKKPKAAKKSPKKPKAAKKSPKKPKAAKKSPKKPKVAKKSPKKKASKPKKPTVKKAKK